MSAKEGTSSPDSVISYHGDNSPKLQHSNQEEFEFIVPAEAPTFYPTESEFTHPLVYIDKIRPIAEKYGICKIKPPPNWQPPFAVDVDKLKFTPRIQRLNELEAKTRIKLNFLDQIAKFWELQGSALKIPMVEKRALDLYTLYRFVDNEGGFTCVTKDRKWAKVAVLMGYPPGKGFGTILKTHYERLLFPFELFAREKNGEEKTEVKLDTEDDTDYKPTNVKFTSTQLNDMNGKKMCYSRRTKAKERFNTLIKAEDIKEEVDGGMDNEQNSKELKRLQIFAPGPKMAGFNEKNKQQMEEKPRGKPVDYIDVDPLSKYVCHNCQRGDAEEQMLLCDGCDDSYHTFCLMPPLGEIPKGDWCCPKCVAAEVSKPTEAFGFEQAQREYNLQQFGEMADTFKSQYFNMPVHLVPTSMVEKEFWRIVSSIDEDVTVEYGADLHTMDHGSGFPTKNSLNLLPGDLEYAYSGWNLNNLPVLEGSVLGYINADISGMKVPWMYVGMCFATFCWHNEDHWSYSINYLHWGEPKTWYGVSGMEAELFEKTMKSAAPELFQSQPDLLHQLVTIMNPNILMTAGVPVYRTDQQAGEFVITFPRAYHAGFNQGYNFAEAVNFAPADWVAMGRECVLHYSQLRRFCVFSHDELVCKMATHAEQLNITVAAATYTDMLRMVETEKRLRKTLLDWGVTNAEREAFELLPDDERQCEICKTTCFMSALTCTCSNDVLVCLRHYSSLCRECPPSKHTLRYRYTLDELLPLLRNLKEKAESFDRWADRVKEVLDRKTPKSVDLNELKALLSEADGKNFPKSDLLQTLANAIEDAEKCASVIKQLDLNKIRTRHSLDNKSKLSLEELRLFCEEIDSLACVLEEEKIIKDLLDKTNRFEEDATKLLKMDLKKCPISDVEELVEFSASLVIDLPTLKPLKERCAQLRWVKEMNETIKRTTDFADIDTLKELLKKGLLLPVDSLIETSLSKLQGIINTAEDWEERAKLLFKKTGNVIPEAESLIKSATKIQVYLPTEHYLIDSVNSVNAWYKHLQKINNLEYYPYLTALEDLVKKSRQFPFHLDEAERLRNYLASASSWREKTSKIFLRKNSFVSIMEGLSPRLHPFGSKNRKKGGADDCIKLTEDMDPTKVVAVFKEAEEREAKLVKRVRATNMEKTLMEGSEDMFCICQRGLSGIMMQCDLCKDWYHANCVPLPKLAMSKYKKNVKLGALHLNFKDCKYLCVHCFRTRRPRLETILSLLMSLQKLHTRLPEGEALQCLTERAMNWQDRARQMVQSPELATAVAKLHSVTQKYTETTARIKSEKVPGAENKKPGNTPELHKRVQELQATSGVSEDDSCSMSDSDEDDCRDEHAYSMNVAKAEENECSIHINSQVRQKIEDLITEGDLLEVNLEEANQLWQILFLSRDMEQFPVIIDFTHTVSKDGGRKGRKRRSDEILKREMKKRMKRKATSARDTKQGRKKKSTDVEEVSSDDDDDDEDGVCAVSTCLQPNGDEVDWVQCDGGCEQWFHMACVGLSAKDINEDEDYICSACSPDSVKQGLNMDPNDIIIEF